MYFSVIFFQGGFVVDFFQGLTIGFCVGIVIGVIISYARSKFLGGK